MTKTKSKMKASEVVRAMVEVGKTTFKIAPGVAVTQVIGTVISAGLPIVTTYFASLTTTALADAYSGVEGADKQVLTYLAITSLLGVLVGAWGILQSYLSDIARYKIESAVTDQMYEQFFAIDYWQYDNRETADSYDRARQFTTFFPYIFSRLADTATNLFTFLFALGALAMVNVWLALLMLVAVVPSAVAQFRLSRLSTNHWRENTEMRRRLYSLEGDLTTPENIAELRLSGVVRFLLDLRLKLRDQDQKTRIDFERKYIFKRVVANLLSASAEVATLIWVVLEISARRQPIGQFLFIQMTVGRIMNGMGNLVSMINYVDEDVMNLYDYQKFMELPVSKTRSIKLSSMKKELRLENIGFNYPGSEAEVLKDVSLTIKQGQRVALVGENGAGKTTLLRVLLGLYQPSSGRVLVDDQDLSQVDIDSWHQQVGVLSQKFIEYRFATAEENVWFGDVSKPKRLRQSEVDTALKKAEAYDFIKKLPNGKKSYLSRWMGSGDETDKSVDLSGGQWQRLALARNFYRDSSIVVLDEPTSAIDALAEARIFKCLFKEKAKTIITVSHRLTTIEKADVIYMMGNGRIIESGTAAELIAKKGRFYEMFEAQIN